MTLVVQWWFFVPFSKRGRVLHPLPVNHPQCPFIQMTDTKSHIPILLQYCGSYSYVRHDPYLPSIPAALQTLGRVEYATIHVVAPPDDSCRRTSRIVTPLILTLFSQRLLDVQKFDSGRFHLSSLGSCPDTQVMTLASSPPSSRCLPFRVCQTLRFLSSQFCRTQRSVFRQQFHPCSCTRIMTLASSPPSIRCSPFGTRVSSISFPST